MTGVTSIWASCGVRAFIWTRGSDDDAVPEISSGSGSLYSTRGLFVNPIKGSNSRGSGRRKRGSYRPHIEAREGGGSVKADHVPRGKLCRATKITSNCFGQAGEGIALYCLIGDDVHPYRINVCNDPVSSRARQVNRDSGGSAGE